MKLKASLLVLLLMAGTVSCVKAPENEDADTTPDAVLDAVSEAWGGIDPFSAKVNDFVSFETTQKIETNPDPYFVLREGMTVKERTVTDEGDTEVIRYKYNYQFDISRGEEQTPQSTKEAERGYRRNKPSTTALSRSSTLNLMSPLHQKDITPMADDSNMILGFERASYLAGVCFEDEDETAACVKAGYDSCERKCVNLKIEEVLRPVPKEVQAQPGCGGFAGCTWRSRVLSFDLIQTYKKGSVSEAYRASFLASFTSQLPFLGRLTDFCIRQLVTLKMADPNDPNNGRKVLVNTCTALTNYKPAP